VSDGNLPVASTYREVAAHLRVMAELVEAGDSLEGSLEYTVPEGTSPGDVVMLRAAYRVGDLAGQGGVRIIGTMGAAR
jgi:hypothetical protein